eukprot:SM000086S23043  [mRNA]  locus=s86:197225:198579:- [translate_table: standard]
MPSCGSASGVDRLTRELRERRELAAPPTTAAVAAAAAAGGRLGCAPSCPAELALQELREELAAAQETAEALGEALAEARRTAEWHRLAAEAMRRDLRNVQAPARSQLPKGSAECYDGDVAVSPPSKAGVRREMLQEAAAVEPAAVALDDALVASSLLSAQRRQQREELQAEVEALRGKLRMMQAASRSTAKGTPTAAKLLQLLVSLSTWPAASEDGLVDASELLIPCPPRTRTPLTLWM